MSRARHVAAARHVKPGMDGGWGPDPEYLVLLVLLNLAVTVSAAAIPVP